MLPTNFQRCLVLVAGLAVVLGSAGVAHAADTTPPVATFVDPLTLNGFATISFNEDVKSVALEDLVLRMNGSSSNLATSLACSAAGGAATDCVAGTVRSVIMRHVDVFVPGQKYDVIVNPSGASQQITDTAGNAAAMTIETFFASPTEQEQSLAATYVWSTVRASGAFDGSYRTERTAGAVSRFRFIGTGVTWYTVTGPSQGWAVVGIDGRAVATVNNRASSAHYQVIRRYTGLASGSHEITIRVLGSRGAPGGDAWVAVDAFRISTTNFDGTNAWQSVRAPSLRGGYARTSSLGARVAFRFRARAIDWYTVIGPDQGAANVFVDNVFKATFDNHAAATKYGTRRSITGLSDAVHTLTIVAGRGMTSVDAWSLKAPTIAFAKLGAWIDLFDFSPSTDPSAMLDEMRSHGVRTLYLETARYSSTTNFGDANDKSAAVGRWLDGAHARGIKVIGWYFPGYGSQLDTDVARTAAIARFRSPGGQTFDGLAIDMEHGGGTRGAEFNDGLRAHLHRVRLSVGSVYPIGAITVAPVAMTLTTTYAGYPWSSIGAEADVVLPMGYWSYRRSSPSQCPGDAAKYCAYGYTTGNVSQARALTKLPVHEIGGVAVYTLNGSTHTIPDADVTDFVRGTKDAAALGASFYDFRTTRPAWWGALETINS